MKKEYDSHIACMIDLETLGTTQDSYILSVGAVWCDLNAPEFSLLKKFYFRVKCAIQFGRKIDISTVGWHVNHTRLETLLENFCLTGETLQDVLLHLRARNAEIRGVETYWSKGVDFDLAILDHAYSQLMEAPPWNFRQKRCFRTLLEVARENEELRTILDYLPGAEEKSKAHTALHDAENQMHMLWRIYDYYSK